MNDKNRNLLIRLVTALIALPVVLWLIARGGGFAVVLFSIVAAVCAGEYYFIVYKRWSFGATVGTLVAAALPLFPWLAPRSAGESAFWLLTGFFIFAWSYFLIAGPLPEAPTRSSHLLSGALFGGLGLTALSALRLSSDGVWWVVCALVVTWANDTAAYFAGRFLGKHKLYPEVSPNKTWEGFFGGMVGSVGGLVVVKLGFFPALTWVDCVCVGVAGGILGPMGDLCESMLKRAYKVKDSGKLVPGHGGFLDRIDALLFNAPMVFVYVRFLKSL